uniref:HD domain-containing protein n=1 Tax=Trepomonas sp. PC1 TaxID=1076344 RepID=A0A146KF09_9EUKA|eukprot:JAP93889.1 HD domain-containing protein [Trepomonas sp. PC1]
MKKNYKNVQDPLYGQIRLEDYIVELVDTPPFQRLRNLRQNANAIMVYPSATHTRFEHCIGVYHLSCRMLQQLHQQIIASNDPDLVLEKLEKAEKLVKIAALLHDIGHGPYSHLFEEVLRRLDIKYKESFFSHEQIGSIIIDKLLRQFQYTNEDIEIIQSIIQGKQIQYEPFNKFAFLQEIVSNSICSLDTDKLDYLVRDAHAVSLPVTVASERIINNCFLFQNLGKYHICYGSNIQFEIQQVFQARYGLHKLLYQHSKVIAVDQNVLEIILKADQLKIIDVQQALSNLSSQQDDWFDLFQELDDNLVNQIQYVARRFNQNKELQASIHRFQSHQIYKNIYRVFVNTNFFNKTHHQLNDFLDQKINNKSIFVSVREIHFGMKEKNPLSYVAFKKQNCVEVSKLLQEKIGADEQNQMIKIYKETPQLNQPKYFTEYGIFIYATKSYNHTELKDIALQCRDAMKQAVDKQEITETQTVVIEELEQFIYE